MGMECRASTMNFVLFLQPCVPAYCRNSVDGQWYSYDDSSVDLVPEEEVCTRGAYILFYQRRDIIPQWSAHCSVRGTQSGDPRNVVRQRCIKFTSSLHGSSLSCKETELKSAAKNDNEMFFFFPSIFCGKKEMAAITLMLHVYELPCLTCRTERWAMRYFQIQDDNL